MMTQLVSACPSALVATQRYFPESSGWQLPISMVTTPSAFVMLYSLRDSSWSPLYHFTCGRVAARVSQTGAHPGAVYVASPSS